MTRHPRAPISPTVSVPATSSALAGAAAAQGMFAVAAQAAAGVSAPNAGSNAGSAQEAAQVAVLTKALQMERSLVNILA